MTAEQLEALLEKHAREIGEHVEAVQIIVTNTEGGICQLCYRGAGNLYARLGMVREYLKILDSQTAANYIAEAVNPPDEEDDWKANVS